MISYDFRGLKKEYSPESAISENPTGFEAYFCKERFSIVKSTIQEILVVAIGCDHRPKTKAIKLLQKVHLGIRRCAIAPGDDVGVDNSVLVAKESANLNRPDGCSHQKIHIPIQWVASLRMGLFLIFSAPNSQPLA